jgi:hypothetical protein
VCSTGEGKGGKASNESVWQLALLEKRVAANNGTMIL